MDAAEHLRERELAQLRSLERRAAGQQFIQQDAERIDVAPRVDIQPAHPGLLWAHVLGRADDRSDLREQRSFGQPLIDRLGHAEVDHLGHGDAVL
jgi:hypothetical protein